MDDFFLPASSHNHYVNHLGEWYWKLSYHKAAEFSTENGSLEELQNHASKDGTLLGYLLLHTQRDWANMGEGVLEEGREEGS